MTDFYCHTQGDKGFRELQIDQDGRMWPCCLIMNVHRFQDTDEIARDAIDALNNTVELQSAIAADPNWNSTEHHTMAEILQHDMFSHTWAYEGVSTSPCTICINQCGSRE